MKLLAGYLAIVLFYMLGELLSLVLALPIPGAIYGLLLLFLASAYAPKLLPNTIMQAAQHLIRILALLLLPATTGIFFLPEEFAEQVPALVGGIILATVLSMVLTVLLMRSLQSWFGQTNIEDSP